MSEGEAAKSPQVTMPSAERIAEELGRVKSLDDFFGRDGVFARLFADTLEGMLATELTQHLGYERYAAEGRNSGNSRNGHYSKKVRTSAGEQKIEVAARSPGGVQSADLAALRAQHQRAGREDHRHVCQRDVAAGY